MIVNNKKENRNIEPFINQTLKRSTCSEDASIEETSYTNTPDYYLHSSIFAEVKELHDGIDTSRSAQWGKVTNKLQKILTEKFALGKIKGLYGVTTPRVYALVGGNKLDLAAEEIIRGIKDNKKEVISQGIKFEIEKVNDKYNEVYLSTHWGGSINPAGTIFQNIAKKLDTADKQLGYQFKKYKIRRKIILLVNKYIFAERISEVIEGLSYCYNDLINYENIDEIYFQQETKEENFIHTKIYDRKFLKEFEDSKIFDNKENREQFQLWYWALEKMGNKQNQLFRALRKFLKKHKPEDAFPDKFKRETMVRLGIWLIDNGRSDEAIWLINKFINDPDPGDPNEYKGDERFDYHKQLKNNEDPTVITTVMGHLAWTVQSLARKSTEKNPKNLIEAYKFTEKVLKNTKNLYLVQQWLVPLIEVANRRWWILEKDTNLYKRFRKLLFGKEKGLVASFGGVPGIAKYMAHIFSYFKDLTTEEADLVLNKICCVDQAMPVLIYFAIYRSLHYQTDTELGNKVTKVDKKILDYSSGNSINLLKKIIKSRDKKYRECQRTIGWNLWKILEEDKDQLKNLKSWIDLLIASASFRNALPHLLRIIDDVSDYDLGESISWYKQALKKFRTDIIPKISPGGYEPFW
ncbi:hypothetical protein MUP35_01090, partial [Patescibacteria group bacterium]|nr:hypothetical protein [Patescibacteria group bacterium]